jgi:hypothetical protein
MLSVVELVEGKREREDSKIEDDATWRETLKKL